jgi:putative transposase
LTPTTSGQRTNTTTDYPTGKTSFPVFSEINSKALQRTATRFYQNISNLSEKKQNGHKVGILNWKSPSEYQSITYSQSGFELKDTSGRHTTVELSKVGDIRIRYHREIPNRAEIKEVSIKKETTGDWFVSFGLETDDEGLPEKPDVDSLNTSNSVGIDLGILNYIHTSDGKTVDWFDLEDEYERLCRDQRKLSRKKKSTPVETALPTDTVSVSAKRVVEAESLGHAPRWFTVSRGLLRG